MFVCNRFYDLDKGRILCNGQDIAEVNIFDYRKHLSLVAQEPTLFQGQFPPTTSNHSMKTKSLS